MKQKIETTLQLLRAKQWVKNTFIFFPLIFSGHLFHAESIQNCLSSFLGFCLLSSGLYIFNDYRDRHLDRLHPLKAQRPLARLEVHPFLISVVILFLLCGGLYISWLVEELILLIGLIYILIHMAYNLHTKNVVILDAFFVAFGFQIRIWVGSVASNVIPSVWLQMCVFLLALFLGFTKRRHEIASLGSRAADHRSVLGHYTAYLLDQIIIICSTLAIVFYGLYTISPEITARIKGPYMVYSVAFVIYGIFRYLYLVHVRKLGGEPGEILATDGSSLINVLLWILYITFLVYNPLRAAHG